MHYPETPKTIEEAKKVIASGYLLDSSYEQNLIAHILSGNLLDEYQYVEDKINHAFNIADKVITRLAVNYLERIKTNEQNSTKFR